MAKEGFLGALGRFASHLSEAAPDGARNAWTAIGPWVAELSRSASQLWLPHLLTGIPCEVLFRGDPCPSPAIAACSVCRKPTCLNHSFAARSGQVVCFPCVKQDIDDHTPAHARGGAAYDPSSPPGSAPPPGPRSRKNAPPPSPPPDPILLARLAHARKILKVKRSASAEDIAQAYRAQAFKHHPDRNPQDRARAAERFREATTAFEFLKQHAAAPGVSP